MSKIDPNAPAFPVAHGIDGTWQQQPRKEYCGMTIRAEIAARIYSAALGGYAVNGSIEDSIYSLLAAESVRATDALIAELNKEPT